MVRLGTRDGFSIQERDVAILRGFFESRIMTAAHVAVLYFDSRKEAAKKRLHVLKVAGLIAERPRRTFEAAVLYLTPAGLDMLEEHGILGQYPAISRATLDRRAYVSDLTLRHELEVMDVKTSLAAALRKSDRFAIAEFTTWPLLNQFESRNLSRTTKPDGFIRISEFGRDDESPGVHSLFLELDRSTEAQSVLVTRAGCYLDHYRSGGFAKNHGAKRSEYTNHPFRVLYVLKTNERLNNTAEALLGNTPPILTHIWLTTISEITSNPLGPIWVRPLDHRNASYGIPFDGGRPSVCPPCNRWSLRESLLEKHIHKQCLFENTHP